MLPWKVHLRRGALGAIRPDTPIITLTTILDQFRESIAPTGHILFLEPSLSLVSRSLRESKCSLAI